VNSIHNCFINAEVLFLVIRMIQTWLLWKKICMESMIMRVYLQNNAKKNFHKFPLLKMKEQYFRWKVVLFLLIEQCNAFFSGAKKYGADILENSRVILVNRKNVGFIEVMTDSGEIFHVSKLILTAGPWVNHLLKISHLSELPITITNEQVAYFPPKSGKTSDFTTNGNFPVFLYASAFYGLPQVANGIPGAKVASHHTGPRVYPGTDEGAHEYGVDVGNLEEVRTLILSHFPDLEPNPTKVIRCLFSMSEDNKFIIGNHVEDVRVILAAGFCGAGFKHGPVVGETLSKLVKGDKVEFDVEKLSMKRFLVPKKANL